MKFSRKLGIALAACLFAAAAYASVPLGFSINPLTLLTQPPLSLSDAMNQLIVQINAQTQAMSTIYPGTGLEPPAGMDTSQATFGTTVQGNPLPLVTNQHITTASANAGVMLVSPTASRTLYAAGPAVIMASGTAAGATSVQLMCSTGSGNGELLETFPVAMLTDKVPTFSSSGGTPVVLGSAFARGCPAGQGIYVSNNGTLTTTTDLYITLPYVAQ